MTNQNWWFTTLLVKQFKHCPPLNKDIKCDVVIVGGGFSGLSAAAEFLGKGLSVVLIEKNIVGGSSSGRSAGFLSPDSELELHELGRRFGTDEARKIWDIPTRGIDRIVKAVKKNNIECGLREMDSLFLGLGKRGKEGVASELEIREGAGFTDQQVYDENELKTILGAVNYTAGIRYPGTYGVNPLACLQGLKDVCIDNGMQVFESTAMVRLEGHTVYTHGGSVTADHIVIAVDKLSSSISPLAGEVSNVQTFLSVTEPLTDKECSELFPSGKQMLCWDSKLVYSYFRLTADNRLLLGGGTPLSTYPRGGANNHHRVITKVIKEFKSHFPNLRNLSFIQYWPGLIDTTRDLLPLVVKPPSQPHLQFILGCVGLAWAAFSGSFAARNILGEADEDYKQYYPYFSNRRPFGLPSALGGAMGKPAFFALSNAWAKYYQVDLHRKPVEMKGEF